jgi:hypothetical protein
MDCKARSRQPSLPERVLLVVLVCAAAVSVSRGFLDALTHSQDMQWSPLVVFWVRHLDPYQEFLRSPHSPLFILSQAPNNQQLVIFLLAPLAWMDFPTAKLAWAIANLAFLALTIHLFRKAAGAGLPWVAAAAFAASTSTRVAIENGQLSLLCLLCSAAYLACAPKRPALAALLSSIGAIKYSLGAPLFFQAKVTPAYVISFCALPLAAVLIWSFRFHLDPIHALLLPAKVAAVDIGGADGVGDLLMALRTLGLPPAPAYALVLAALVAIAGLQRRYLAVTDRLALCAFYATVSLWLTYHRIYDFVFLLPVAVVAARSATPHVRYGLMLGVGYFWFGFETLIRAGIAESPLADNLMLLAMLALVSLEMRGVSAQRGEAGLEPSAAISGGSRP